MPGNCYSCATTFGLFKKELGCKNCGYAFCKECLTKKTAVPKHNNEKHKVCNKCFKILTGKAKPEDSTAKYSPPAALVKRMAALEEREKQKAAGSATAGGATAKPGPSQPNVNMAKYRGMSKEDIAIAQRLEALKKDKPAVPSQKEMETRLAQLKDDGKPPPPTSDEMSERLAKLRGVDPATVNKPHVFQSDRRPEQQQIDDLLQEIGEEVSIDSYGACGSTQDSELENNLNKQSNDPQKTYNKNIAMPSHSQQGAGEEGKDESELDLAEVQRLMESVAREMEIDAQRAMQGLQQDKELMDRLQKVKQRDKNENPSKNDDTEDTTKAVVIGGCTAEEGSDDENDEETIKNIIKQHLEEARLDEEADDAELTGVSHQEQESKKRKKVTNTDGCPEYDSDPDEFPWCCICNEDASLRCYDCDGDLYCRRCFREGHDKLDLEEHRTTSYKPSKSK